MKESGQTYLESARNATEGVEEIVNQKVESLDTLRGAWILSVIENGVEDTLQSELYDSLRRAYQDVGVRVSYKPFSK